MACWNPNHYLAVAIEYLYTNRPDWPGREALPFLKTAVIRAIPLVESLPAVYADGGDALGARALRGAGSTPPAGISRRASSSSSWPTPSSVWPDRFGVDIKTTPFLADIFRRLVAICLSAGPCPSAAWPPRCPATIPRSTASAGESIRADKEWEARAGLHPRLGRPHLPHEDRGRSVPQAHRLGLEADAARWPIPTGYPVRIEVPAGPITLEGTRRNARMVVEYVEGWLNGRGAKGIDSLAGKPGVHPALMEDLATGRMSVAQIAQRIRHRRARRPRAPRRSTTSPW